MSREKRTCDQLTFPVKRGQRARWQAAARLRATAEPTDLAVWIGSILDAAADYERAVGRSATDLLQMMIPITLRPLLRAPAGLNGHSTAMAVPAAPVNTTTVSVPVPAAPMAQELADVTLSAEDPALPARSGCAASESPPGPP